MIAGICKSQWLLIMATGASVVLINATGMWQQFLLYEVRVKQYLELTELYSCGIPWTKFILETISITVLLIAFAWLIVLMSKTASFQRMPYPLKYGSEGLIAIFVGAIFMAVSISFSNSWVYGFWCGPMAGLAKSSFVAYWSTRFVFPAVSMLNFWSMCLSNSRVENSFAAVT